MAWTPQRDGAFAPQWNEVLGSEKMGTDNNTMDKLVSLCKRRGFIFQSSEIYGGLNSCYDYGPLGVELKRNVKDFWWRAMTQLHLGQTVKNRSQKPPPKSNVTKTDYFNRRQEVVIGC